MLPPPCQGGIASSTLLLAVDRADAGGAEDLVARRRRRSRSRAPARRPRRCETACAPSTRTLAPWRWAISTISRTGQDRAERVGDVGERDQPRARPEEPLVLLEDASARCRRPARPAAGRPSRRQSSCQGTMLAWCSSQVRTISSPSPTWRRPPALRDQVDALGGAAHEDDLLRRAGVEEAPHRLARRLVGVGGAGGQRVGGAVDVGVLVLVEAREAVDDRPRLLGGGGVVEPDERAAVDALREDREVAPEGRADRRSDRRASVQWRRPRAKPSVRRQARGDRGGRLGRVRGCAPVESSPRPARPGGSRTTGVESRAPGSNGGGHRRRAEAAGGEPGESPQVALDPAPPGGCGVRPSATGGRPGGADARRAGEGAEHLRGHLRQNRRLRHAREHGRHRTSNVSTHAGVDACQRLSRSVAAAAASCSVVLMVVPDLDVLEHAERVVGEDRRRAVERRSGTTRWPCG